MKIIAKYGAILEPFGNILPSVSMELHKAREHVEELLKNNKITAKKNL